MEFIKAWVWKEEKRRDNGEVIDDTLLKYVKKLYESQRDLVLSGFVIREKNGNYRLAEIANLQVENRFLKEEVERLKGALNDSK